MTRAHFDDQTDPDFWEVGASGTVYDRQEIWATLQTRWADRDYQDEWSATNFLCRQLGPDCYLLTYLLRQGPRVTRRATIWRKAEPGWQVVYHQGTIVEAAS